jgi:hypothetical protein
MTQQEMDTINQLMAEKHVVVKELMNHLHEAQYDRTQLTSDMLKVLRDKIDIMLVSDF